MKVVVAGAGYWGKNLVRNFDQIGSLYGICDNNPDNPIYQQYASTKKYSLFSEVLNDSTVDAVAIATPAELHYSMVKEAIIAGKHVFVEKPLALHIEEGKELVALSKKYNKILMVGHLLQYHPAVTKLREMIDNGELGKLYYIYSNRLNLGKIRSEENILWSFAPHDISVMLSLIGEMPDEVSSFGGCYLHGDIADVTMSTISFPGGIKSHIYVSWLHPYKEQKFVVVGSEKMAVFDDVLKKDKLVVYPHKIDWKGNVPVPNKQDAQPVELPEVEPLKEECIHFVECIKSGKKPKTDGEEGIRVLTVLQMCQESLTSKGKPVHAKSESIKGFSVHESACIDNDVSIGDGTNIWHFSHILKDTKIGKNCKIGQNVVIGPKVQVGEGCKIQNNVSIYEGVTLEDYVFCGPSMVFTNIINPRAEIPRMSEVKKTLVKRGVTFGANSTIICGNTIGKYAFIGSGAVVTKDVPDYAVVIGNPGRIEEWMCECGVRLEFENEDAKCNVCNKAYMKDNMTVLRKD